MATEYELKFRATPQVLDAIAHTYSGTARQITMETTYYDTPTGALSARHCTLRRRLENGISVCTLKVPLGNARGEWETECEDIALAIPRLVELGCPEAVACLVQEGLIPICGAAFTRLAKTVSLPEGTVELALDNGLLTGGGRQVPLCEVEVELKSGARQVCDAFARDLAVRFQLQPEESSKFRRALALYKGEDHA